MWSSSLRGRESLKCQPWGIGREDPIQRPGSRQLLWEGIVLGSSSASESAEQEPGQGGDREGLVEDPGFTGGRETRKEALLCGCSRVCCGQARGLLCLSGLPFRWPPSLLHHCPPPKTLLILTSVPC